MNTAVDTMKVDLDATIRQARRQTLGDLLRRTASRYPQRSAVECGEHIRWTYAEYDRKCDQLASGLLATGLQKGDRIAVLARNSHSFALLRFALARAGGVLVPINFMLNAEEIAFILKHSGASALCVDAEFTATGQAAAQQVGTIETFWGLESEAGETPEGFTTLDRLLDDNADPLALAGWTLLAATSPRAFTPAAPNRNPRARCLPTMP